MIPADGQGTRAVFSEKDLKQIIFFIELLQWGFSRKAASKIIREIEPGFTKESKNFFLTFTG